MKITVNQTNQWTKRYSPACETATLFAELIGRQDFNLADIEGIKRLGYTVELQHNLPSTL